MSTITPGSEQQAIYIHCVEALVATARYQRWPSDAHRELAERRKRWLEQAGGMQSLSERGQQLAQTAAANRLAPDDSADRCHCGSCGTTNDSSDSSESVTADHGRELPRAAAN